MNIRLERADIEEAIKRTTTMGGAAKYLRVHHNTFKREAERFGLYKPAGQTNRKFDLKDILDGKYPQYPTSKLLLRLVREGLKEYRCEECDISEWNNKRIGLELDHIDGDNSNHSFENLRILCPNCHSQTETYKSKNIRRKVIAEMVST